MSNLLSVQGIDVRYGDVQVVWGCSLDIGEGDLSRLGSSNTLPLVNADGMIENGMVIAGNPDRCHQVCERYANVGVDQLILHMQTWDTPHDQIMRSIAAFGKYIIPSLGGARS